MRCASRATGRPPGLRDRRRWTAPLACQAAAAARRPAAPSSSTWRIEMGEGGEGREGNLRSQDAGAGCARRTESCRSDATPGRRARAQGQRRTTSAHVLGGAVGKAGPRAARNQRDEVRAESVRDLRCVFSFRCNSSVCNDGSNGPFGHSPATCDDVMRHDSYVQVEGLR